MGTQNDLKYEFQSTLSVRRATGHQQQLKTALQISIHALREESDLYKNKGMIINYGISIHALREESDKLLSIDTSSSEDFNPRSP